MSPPKPALGAREPLPRRSPDAPDADPRRHLHGPRGHDRDHHVPVPRPPLPLVDPGTVLRHDDLPAAVPPDAAIHPRAAQPRALPAGPAALLPCLRAAARARWSRPCASEPSWKANRRRGRGSDDPARPRGSAPAGPRPGRNAARGRPGPLFTNPGPRRHDAAARYRGDRRFRNGGRAAPADAGDQVQPHPRLWREPRRHPGRHGDSRPPGL